MAVNFITIDRDIPYLLPPSVQVYMPEGMDIPEELKRREDRLAKIAAAKAEIAARARERFVREQAEYEEKVARRKDKEERTGKKSGGRPPKTPSAEPKPKDQIRLTDEDSRIMPSNAGFVLAYNAQAGADADTHLLVEQHLGKQPNDKQEVAPTVQGPQQLPDALSKVEKRLADTGYFSEANVNTAESGGMPPYIAQSRQGHNESLHERFGDDPPAPSQPTAVEAMVRRLSTPEGKAVYAKRNSTVETVFGIIKQMMGFRQFLPRGRDSVTGEWGLVVHGLEFEAVTRVKGAMKASRQTKMAQTALRRQREMSLPPFGGLATRIAPRLRSVLLYGGNGEQVPI